MIYIEFYDPVSVENIATCLTYQPDRVIIIGAGDYVDARIRSYKKLLNEKRGLHVEIGAKNINKTNLAEAVKQLNYLVENEDDIVFDITGGDEILVLALGMVCAAHPEKKMQIHKVNLHTGTLVDCDRDGETVFENPPRLSIEENVLIYGGEVLFNHNNDINGEDTYRWDLSEDFLADVNTMWDLCRSKGRFWNVQISILETVSAGSRPTDVTVSAKADAVRTALLEKRIDYDQKLDRDFVDALLRLGLLISYDDSGDTITATFKNAQVKKCLTTEGQVLELKMYLIAKHATDNGVPVYDDALNGVKIDWDGVVHTQTENVDVDNEIDVMLMHGLVPIFISCKNGDLKPEELYKLHTVARRFGGPYARMVLVAPAIDRLKNGSVLRERAEEMGIIVLAGNEILRADDGALTALLASLWSN